MLRLFRLTFASIAVAGCFQLDLTTSTEALAQECQVQPQRRRDLPPA